MGRDPGRDERFVEFVAASQRDLRRTAYLLCGDWQLSEDAVQTAIFRVYLRWSRIEREGSVWSYARRAVINAVIDQQRRAWRVETFVSDLPEHASAETARILKCPPNTVTTWTARALTSLRKFLTAHGVVRGTPKETT